MSIDHQGLSGIEPAIQAVKIEILIQIAPGIQVAMDIDAVYLSDLRYQIGPVRAFEEIDLNLAGAP